MLAHLKNIICGVDKGKFSGEKRGVDPAKILVDAERRALERARRGELNDALSNFIVVELPQSYTVLSRFYESKMRGGGMVEYGVLVRGFKIVVTSKGATLEPVEVKCLVGRALFTRRLLRGTVVSYYEVREDPVCYQESDSPDALGVGFLALVLVFREELQRALAVIGDAVREALSKLQKR